MKRQGKKTNAQLRRRLDIMVSPETLALLDRIAPKGKRSRVIETAVKFFVEKRGKANLREQLKQEALRNAKEDLIIAQEWFSIDEEAWEKYGK